MRRRRTTTTWGERVGWAQSRAGRESVRFGAVLRTWDRTWSSGMPIRPATMATCCSGSAARSCAAAMASSIVGGSWRTRGGPENLGGLDLERTGGIMIGPYPITSSLCSGVEAELDCDMSVTPPAPNPGLTRDAPRRTRGHKVYLGEGPLWRRQGDLGGNPDHYAPVERLRAANAASNTIGPFGTSASVCPCGRGGRRVCVTDSLQPQSPAVHPGSFTCCWLRFNRELASPEPHSVRYSWGIAYVNTAIHVSGPEYS